MRMHKCNFIQLRTTMDGKKCSILFFNVTVSTLSYTQTRLVGQQFMRLHKYIYLVYVQESELICILYQISTISLKCVRPTITTKATGTEPKSDIDAEDYPN